MVAILALALTVGTGGYIALMADVILSDLSEGPAAGTVVIAALACLVVATVTMTILRARPARPTSAEMYEMGLQDSHAND
ncbi:hypothetical protein [Streptosporangium canum]|uniref:hypothetical protein n=1 Tax=Streptosporangium canum TaxID=324952 RepID=UPI0037918792